MTIYHCKPYDFGAGAICLASCIDEPGLLIMRNRGKPQEVGKLTDEDVPEGTDPYDPDNIVLVFHNRRGIRNLIDHLQEIEANWEQQFLARGETW